MRIRYRGPIGLAICASLLTLAAMAAGITPAAAAGCYGNTCTGLDPTAEGCNNVQTIDSVSDGDLTAQLRYSPDCYAVWVKIIGPNDGQGYGGAVDGYTSKSNPYASVEYIAAPPSPGGNHSSMVSFHYWTKACIAYSDFGWETLNCTGFH